MPISPPPGADVLPGAAHYHVPVLADAVLTAFAGATCVVDGTLGGGGHAALLLARGIRVIGVDRDPEARDAAAARLRDAVAAGRLTIVAATFADAVSQVGAGTIDGVLLDLGVSSHQLDETARGFSFRPGAPLDARMSPDASRSAADVLNDSSEEMLVRIFADYGDEPRARRLAREVLRRRETRPFVISDDFVGAIRATLGAASGAGDFARLFQALRIAVNDEIDTLEAALPAWAERLAPGGVFAVISYHSGEDRVVKHVFRDWSTSCTCPPRQPICTCGGVARGAVMTRRAIVADAAEAATNPRARSARLRVWRKAP